MRSLAAVRTSVRVHVGFEKFEQKRWTQSKAPPSPLLDYATRLAAQPKYRKSSTGKEAMQ